jgi:hypothetical protein
MWFYFVIKSSSGLFNTSTSMQEAKSHEQTNKYSMWDQLTCIRLIMSGQTHQFLPEAHAALSYIPKSRTGTGEISGLKKMILFQ